MLTGKACAQVVAQSVMAGLSGTITDPSGALVPGAVVHLSSDSKELSTAEADEVGRFTFAALEPGSYLITVEAPGFAAKKSASIILLAGQRITLNVQLTLEIQTQEVKVGQETTDADPARGGTATILKGPALDLLSDEPGQMLDQLKGMAGGDGESSQSMYIDGFSGGKMPPKSAIREIRINDNPYSAEYEDQGNGRIEVFTKPGGDTLHGDFYGIGSDSALDSKNPYSPANQPFYSNHLEGELGGPIHKKTSYFLSGSNNYDQNSAIVNAEILNAAYQQVGFTQAVSNPTESASVSGRLDAQVSTMNTLTGRYEFDRTSQSNAGVGQLQLAAQGYSSKSDVGTLQIGDTETFGAKVVNESRFQYIRTRSSQNPVSAAPTLVVQGAFTDGGNNLGLYTDHQDQYEFQNYLSVDLGKHFVRTGVRERLNRDANASIANYNGEYIFSSLQTYQLTEQGLKAGLTPAQVRASGGGASQFNITAGDPSIAVHISDTALYAEDTWKAAPELTISYGLRFETQNYIHDHADFAPRLYFAYGIHKVDKKAALLVLHGGFGSFYDRFPAGDIVEAARENGVRQQQYVVNTPDTYPQIPVVSSLLKDTAPTIFQLSPTYHSPYVLQYGFNVSHDSEKHGSLTLGYRGNHGVHQLLSRNINAPLPGTYNPVDPTSGIRPLGGTQNLYEYDTLGVSRRNRVFLNGNYRLKDKVFVYCNYSYGFTRADTDGGFPSDQYAVARDYGRASYDVRHRFFFGSFAKGPYGISAGSYLIAQTGRPFDIVVGDDLNGDSQFNDRPAFATDLARPSVIRTKYGNFDTAPIAGQQIIPNNYGNGPGLLQLNFEMSKSVNFGPVVKLPADAPAPEPVKAGSKPLPMEHRYTLDGTVYADNVLNHVNPAPPVGTLGSQLFGKSNALNSSFSDGSANRTLNLLVRLRF